MVSRQYSAQSTNRSNTNPVVYEGVIRSLANTFPLLSWDTQNIDVDTDGDFYNDLE